MTRRSGAEWLEASLKLKSISPLGGAVANLLDDLLGLHHLEIEALKKVDWSSDHHIEFVLGYQTLATFDSDELTRLVFLCHDYAIRCSIGGRANHYLVLMFHQRQREGRLSERHPTAEAALAMFRLNHQPPEKE